ncbi:MAG: hypothetical protein KAT46_06090 [Deltaproteobacteria bacterium]|nr:hypothetical protein [Deltaproteobacteria bacterium]
MKKLYILITLIVIVSLGGLSFYLDLKACNMPIYGAMGMMASAFFVAITLIWMLIKKDSTPLKITLLALIIFFIEVVYISIPLAKKQDSFNKKTGFLIVSALQAHHEITKRYPTALLSLIPEYIDELPRTKSCSGRGDFSYYSNTWHSYRLSFEGMRYNNYEYTTRTKEWRIKE